MSILSLKDKRNFLVLFFFLLGVSLFRIYYIQAGPLDLSPDEAQYWDWSRNLALSYYSKGPGIAYIIKVSTALFGNTVLGVRIPAVVFIFLSTLVIFRLTIQLTERFNGFWPVSKRERVALLNAFVFNMTALFATFGIINTIDSPLIFFWSLALLLFWHLVADWPIKKRGIGLWILLGLVVGIGILVKYSMVFFLLSAFVFLLFNKHKRRLLIRPGPWLGFATSFLASLPIIIWNAQHRWVTFHHTAWQAHLDEGFVIKPLSFLEFLGSQIGVIGPVLFVIMIMAVYWSFRQKKDEGFIFWFSVPAFLFFLVKSLQGKVQANWALPSYITPTIATGIYIYSQWDHWKGAWRFVVTAGLMITLLITIIAHYPMLIGIPPSMDPSARLRGWRSIGNEVSRIVDGLNGPYFIFSDRYQITAELAFYVRGQPRTYCINLGRRMNQYDLWPGFYELKGYDGVFVTRGKRSLPPEIAHSFDECKRRLFTIKEGRYVLRQYSIFVCKNFHGMKRVSSEHF